MVEGEAVFESFEELEDLEDCPAVAGYPKRSGGLLTRELFLMIGEVETSFGGMYVYR